MGRALFLILQVVLWPRVPALFTVAVTSSSHQAEFGGSVTMECRFLPGGSEQSMSVFWHRIHPEPPMEVYRLENGQEGARYQDPHYAGRARLMRAELKNGQSLLQISNLRITDSGTYRCLVEMGGVDYKQTALTVRAPYKSIYKSAKTTERGVELSCESQGYPLANVVWTDSTGRNITKEFTFTIATTADQLFHITSTITVERSNNTYTCTFVGEGLVDQSVLFHIPEEIPVKITESSSFFSFVFVMIGIITVCVGIAVYCKCQGYKRSIIARPSDCLLPEDYAAACVPREATIEVQTSEGQERNGRVESLGEALRSSYAGLTSEALEHFCDKVLPQHLWNRDGSPLGVATLLPGAGESLLLEGEPKSGKTSVALALASAWARNSEWDPFGVKRCPLVVLVPCEGGAGDLFQEVMSRLGPEGEELTVSTLRGILTGPAEALIVLDGYASGNAELDESLGGFLRGRQARCRVLVTALPGECGDLTELFDAVAVLTREGAGRCGRC